MARRPRSSKRVVRQMPALDEPVGAAAGAKGPALQLSWGRFLLGGGIVLALGGGVWYLTGTDRAGDLPAPPATGLSAAVADHLHQRYATAQQHPSSHVAIGSLCIAYHADMLFDLAERCYARASEIDSSSWRWPYFRA